MDRRGNMTFPSTGCCCAIISVVLMSFFSQVTGDLVVAPKNQVAAVGQSVQLNCSTDDRISVNWQHFPFGSTTPNDVYISRTVVFPYTPRFTIKNGIIIEKRSLGNNITAFNLLIRDIRTEDAGTYRCVDRTGMGEQRNAELTVIGTHLNCSTNIGPKGFICENDCHYLIDKIHSSCSIEYAGNIAPEMQWTTTSGQNTIQPQPVTNVSEKTVSSEWSFNTTTSVNGASVIWFSTQSMQTKWTSAPIKTLYAKQNLTALILSQSKTVTCAVNSSQHCNYIWTAKIDQDIEFKPIIGGQTLEINKSGIYLCRAHCPLHHLPCTVEALHVEYRNGNQCSSNLLIAIVIPLCLLLIVVTSVAIYLWMKQNRLCGTSSSSNGGSSQSSDEAKSLVKTNSNGICNNSSATPAYEKERQVDVC